jgi:hypothetical protein
LNQGSRFVVLVELANQMKRYSELARTSVHKVQNTPDPIFVSTQPGPYDKTQNNHHNNQNYTNAQDDSTDPYHLPLGLPDQLSFFCLPQPPSDFRNREEKPWSDTETYVSDVHIDVRFDFLRSWHL